MSQEREVDGESGAADDPGPSDCEASDSGSRMERGVPSDATPGEDAEARRLAALYGLGEPPEDDGGRNPFWWIWAFVVPFMLLGMALMAWRLVSTPSRSLPGL